MAERGLACCKALLAACPPTHPTQLTNLLQRFGAVAALPRDAATEEVYSPCRILTRFRLISDPCPFHVTLQTLLLLLSCAHHVATKLNIKLFRFLAMQMTSRKPNAPMGLLLGHRHSCIWLAGWLAGWLTGRCGSCLDYTCTGKVELWAADCLAPASVRRH